MLFVNVHYFSSLKETRLFKTSELIRQPLIKSIWKEVFAPKRDSDVTDESIYSFISRRLGPEIAENLMDPVFKGISGGDIKQLSARSLLAKIYDFEGQSGSIVKGAFEHVLSTSTCHCLLQHSSETHNLYIHIIFVA